MVTCPDVLLGSPHNMFLTSVLYRLAQKLLKSKLAKQPSAPEQQEPKIGLTNLEENNKRENAMQIILKQRQALLEEVQYIFVFSRQYLFSVVK